MKGETNKHGVDALEAAIGKKQEGAAESHAELIQYVHEVKDALSTLVDKVVRDQETTSKLFSDARHELDAYKEVLSEGSDEVDVLHGRVAELENVEAQYESKIESYKQKLEQSKKQLRDQAGLSEDNEAHRARVADLENRLLEITELNDAANRRISNLGDDLNRQLEAVNAAEDLQQELKTLRADAQNHASTLDASRAALEPLTLDLVATRENLEESNSEVASLREQIESLALSTSNSGSELERQQNQYEADLKHAKEHEGVLESSLAEAQRSQDELQEQLGAAHHELELEKGRAAELNEQVQAHSDSGAGQQHEVDELHEQIKLLESTTDSNFQTISELKSELTTANVKADRAEERFEELRSHAKQTAESEREKAAALEHAQADLDSIRGDADLSSKLQEQCDALELQLTQLRERNTTIEDELAAELAKGTKSILAKQLSDALQDYETSQDVNQNLHTEIESLKEQLAAAANSGDVQQPRRIEFDEVAAKQRLGDLLLETNVITSEQLSEVLREREEGVQHGKIGQAFIDKGFVTEDVVVQALSHQMEVPFLRIEHNSVQRDALRLISERLAEKHACMPIRLEDDTLVLAMENPKDLIAIEDVERMSEFTVAPVISTHTDIMESIEQHYQGKPPTS